MRDERLYLRDIVQAVRAIEDFTAGLDGEVFTSCDDVRSAVLCKLVIIGVAAAHLSTELRERHPEVDWTAIMAFPDAYVGLYYDIHWHDTWETASVRIPALGERVAHILKEEFSAPEEG